LKEQLVGFREFDSWLAQKWKRIPLTARSRRFDPASAD